ncbi:ThiF family adenylyltransferase, partial [Plesiomonas sp.]
MLTDKQFIRFSRQIMLPEVGEAGQQRLAQLRVLQIGVGGLGCSAAQAL